MTFSDLTVIARAGSTRFGEAAWLCRCSCGTEIVAPGSGLRRGNKKSCGCAWRTTFEETRICSRCKSEKPHEDFYRTKGGVFESMCIDCKLYPCSVFYQAHPEIYGARSVRVKRQRRERRARILKAYGDRCACCGETEKMFLAIDHKEGGGSRHKAEIGGGDMFYQWLENEGFPDDFQILCHNCNWGKHINGGVCPHQAKQPGPGLEVH